VRPSVITTGYIASISEGRVGGTSTVVVVVGGSVVVGGGSVVVTVTDVADGCVVMVVVSVVPGEQLATKTAPATVRPGRRLMSSPLVVSTLPSVSGLDLNGIQRRATKSHRVFTPIDHRTPADGRHALQLVRWSMPTFKSLSPPLPGNHGRASSLE
jgi:hypothetical protein